jgi:hypothetical protein
MTTRTSKVDTFVDHESLVAERYRWWGVYLIREKRRLGGIAEAVQAEAAQAVVRSGEGRSGLPDLPADIELPDELLTRVDAELALNDALEELEAGDEQPESDTTDRVAEPDDDLQRKLSGRAALLGQQAREDEDDSY